MSIRKQGLKACCQRYEGMWLPKTPPISEPGIWPRAKAHRIFEEGKGPHEPSAGRRLPGLERINLTYICVSHSFEKPGRALAFACSEGWNLARVGILLGKKPCHCNGLFLHIGVAGLHETAADARVLTQSQELRNTA